MLSAAQDLSAFAMPLLESDLQDGIGTMDLDSSDGRPRSSSGSSGLKLFGGKGRQRNKSGDESGKNGSSPTTSSKVKSFFDTFRPRSKSDVSGLKKPGKKARDGMGSLATERSLDESSSATSATAASTPGGAAFGAQYVPGFKMPVDPISPMGQILEGQMMLGVPGGDGSGSGGGGGGGGGSAADRTRHKSGGVVGYDNFMSKFRTRSNSDSRTKGMPSPRRPLVSQVRRLGLLLLLFLVVVVVVCVCVLSWCVFRNSCVMLLLLVVVVVVVVVVCCFVLVCVCVCVCVCVQEFLCYVG